MEPEQAFGDVLRELGRRRKLSQETLALEAGIERNYVSLLELGKNSVSIQMLFKLCDVLEVTPSAFLGDVERRMKTLREPRRVKIQVWDCSIATYPPPPFSGKGAVAQ